MASIAARALESHLKRLSVMDPFWLVTGAEDLLKEESVDLIRRRARELGYADRQVLEMTTRSDWGELGEAAAALGMFDAQKIVEVRVPGGRPGPKGTEAILRYVERPYEGVTTIFTFPEADWQLAKADWWRRFTQASTVVDCSSVTRRELPSWLSQRLERNKQSADRETLEYFADLVEGNLLAANQEVEKLSLLFPEGPLTREMIEESVSNCSRFDTTSLIRAVSLGEAERVARIVDGLEAQAEPLPMVLAFFTAHVRSIAKLRAGFDAGRSRVQGVFATPELTAAAKRLTQRRLANALLVLADIDRIAKGLPVPGRDDDPWIELKSVALFLAR